jgi:AbrB family looped-hinge helix DNA binding protein
MATSTLSSKGQITLPVRMRRQIGLRPNDAVTIETVGDAIVIKRAADFFELRGFLGKACSPDIEAKRMRDAVGRHVLDKKR